MELVTFDQRDMESRIIAARLRAAGLAPFSPSWDAVMGEVEDLERALWRLQLDASSSDAAARKVVVGREATRA